MIVTRVTTSTTSVRMSNHTAALLSVFLRKMIDASGPEDFALAANTVNEKFKMTVEGMDAVATILQVERLLNRTITDIYTLLAAEYGISDEQDIVLGTKETVN